MLSKQDNEIMCRVGPDTPMGKAMRRFWLPAMQASELLDRDSEPRHLELLGEHFVAFRDTNGNVGILAEPAVIAARPCSLVELRIAVFGASIMAGNLRMTALSWKRRM